MIEANPDVVARAMGLDSTCHACARGVAGPDGFTYGSPDRAQVSRVRRALLGGAGRATLFVEMFGRTNLDLFHWIKAREKLDSYKLDFVGGHFVGQKKNDMDRKTSSNGRAAIRRKSPWWAHTASKIATCSSS